MHYTIEHLIKYIEDKGYTVRLFHQTLIISKMTGSSLIYCSYWTVPTYLFSSSMPQDILERMADNYMRIADGEQLADNQEHRT